MRTLVIAMLALVCVTGCEEPTAEDLAGEEAARASTLARMPNETDETADAGAQAAEPAQDVALPAQADAGAPDGASAPDGAAQVAPDAAAAKPDAQAEVLPVKAFYDDRPISVIFEGAVAPRVRLRFTLTIHVNAQGYDTVEVFDELTQTQLRNGTGHLVAWPRWIGGTPDGYTFEVLFDPAMDTITSLNLTGAALSDTSRHHAFQVASFADAAL